MIETFYDTTVQVTRESAPTPTSNNSIVTVGDVLGVFRPVEEEDKVYLGNNIAQASCFICDKDSDILISDNLTVGSDTYSVKGLSKYVDLEDDTDSYLKAIVSI